MGDDGAPVAEGRSEVDVGFGEAIMVAEWNEARAKGFSEETDLGIQRGRVVG